MHYCNYAPACLLFILLQMIQHGCKPDMADYDGRTALELACVKGHTEVRAPLLLFGLERCSSAAPMPAAQALFRGSTCSVPGKGPPVLPAIQSVAYKTECNSSLLTAGTCSRVQVAAMLLRSGANPNLKDNLGSCALLEACKYGHDDLVKLLKQHGARCGHGARFCFDSC